MATSNIRSIEEVIQKLNSTRENQAHRRRVEKLKVVQTTILPWCFDDVRGRIPNAFLRSALFGVIQRGARAYLEQTQLYSQDGITVRYTGPRLDQNDLDVWEAVWVSPNFTDTFIKLVKIEGNVRDVTNGITQEIQPGVQV